MHVPELREYDRQLRGNTGVIVTWNPADAKSHTLADAVQDALRNRISLLGRVVEDAARTVHDAIFTKEEFQGVLTKLLVFLQGVVLGRGMSVRRIDDQAGPIPTVAGPAGS